MCATMTSGADEHDVDERSIDGNGSAGARPSVRRKRDDTFFKVLDAALELDFRKGHMKWTMSELARKSGITRSLIYYHFGRSKISILQEAVRMMGEEMIGLKASRLELWRQGRMVESLKAARAIAKASPHIGQFYLAHRDRPTDIGEGLRRIEKEYLKKLGIFFPRANEAALRTLYTVFFGMCFSPLSDDGVIDLLADSIQRLSR